MCELRKFKLPQDNEIVEGYEVLVRGEPVGKLVGATDTKLVDDIDRTYWRFEVSDIDSKLIPEKLKNIDCQIFTSFEEVKKAITGEE